MNRPYKILWRILFAGLFGFLLWNCNAQSNITVVETVTLTTVVSNDWVSVAHVRFHNGSNANWLMPVWVTNKYITGTDVKLSTTNSLVSTNMCDARFISMEPPGPPWSHEVPNYRAWLTNLTLPK